jgi:hypothetical protein
MYSATSMDSLFHIPLSFPEMKSPLFCFAIPFLIFSPLASVYHIMFTSSQTSSKPRISHVNHIIIHRKISSRPTPSHYRFRSTLISVFAKVIATISINQPFISSIIHHHPAPIRQLQPTHPHIPSNNFTAFHPIPSLASKKLSRPRYAMQHQVKSEISNSIRNEVKRAFYREIKR